MTPQEVYDACQKQASMQGSMGRVVFWLPGRSPKNGKKRLFGNSGPVGEVLIERSDSCLCMFEATAVMDAVMPLLSAKGD